MSAVNIPAAFFFPSHQDHVLVKGQPDGTILAVYGPYSRARAEWLKTEIADGPGWTVAALRDFAEPVEADAP